jgi:hypothetical protein
MTWMGVRQLKTGMKDVFRDHSGIDSFQVIKIALFPS